MRSHSSSGITCYDWGGPVAAPPLVLLHGFSDSGWCWAAAVDRWSTDFRVLTVDVRGHGLSERFTPYELAAGPQAIMVADIVQLLDDWPALAGRPVGLVGHSMGGGIACEVALTRPDRLAAVVLEDPALGPGDSTTSEQEAEIRREWGRLQVTQLIRYAVDPGFAAAEVAQFLRTSPAVEAEPWLTSKRQTDLDMAADGRIRPERPWRPAISALAVPTLVVSGTGEVIWDPQEWAALQSCGNPLVETAVVDGADHCVRRTQPDRFHAVVDPWLGRHLLSC